MNKTAFAGRLARLLIGTAALAATAQVAAAQPFYRAWGGYYAAPPPFYDDDYDDGPYYRRPLPPYRPGAFYAPGSGDFAEFGGGGIARRAAAAGYRLTAPPRTIGRTIVAVGEDRNGRRRRLVFDAGDGRLIANKPLAETRRVGAVAPPKSLPPLIDKQAPAAAPAKIEPGANPPPASQEAAPAKVPVDAGTRVRVDKDPLAIPRAPAENAAPATPRETTHAEPPAPAAAPAATAHEASPPADAGRSVDATAPADAPHSEEK